MQLLAPTRVNNMATIIALVTVIILSSQISGLDSSGISTTSEFVLYQNRMKILLTRMKAEGCSIPGAVNKRNVLSMTPKSLVLSETIDDKLQVEKMLYEKMSDVLVKCLVAKLRPTTAAIKCPKDYILNPVSSTCLRLVNRMMTWSTAKAACESAGEYLAVFETQESVRWLYSFMKDSKTPAAWKGHAIFIGLKYTNGFWRWAGRLTNVLSDDDDVWTTGHPNKDIESTHPYGCCVVQSYLNWLQDSDYNPQCLLCNGRLDDENYGPCARLLCYDIFHWSCLNRYAISLPATTAPAGYQCPKCKGPIFPASNVVSPVADKLRDLLTKANWARAGLGLPLIEKQELPPDVPSHTPSTQSDTPPPRQATPTSAYDRVTPSSSETQISKSVHPVQPTVKSSGSYNTPSGGSGSYTQPQVYSRTAELQGSASSQSHVINMSDHDTDKYKRRSAFHFLSQWFKSRDNMSGKPGKAMSTQKRFFITIGLGIIGFLTILVIFSRLSSGSEDDFAMEQEAMANLNIRVGNE